MSRHYRHRAKYRSLVGMLLIIVGAVLLLDRVIGLDVGGFGRWWPLILVGLGLWKLSDTENGTRHSGMVLVLIGGVFLVKPVLRLVTSDGDYFDDFHIWPLIIVAVGVAIIWGTLWPARRLEGDKNDES